MLFNPVLVRLSKISIALGVLLSSLALGLFITQSDGATTYGLRVDGVMDNVRDHVGVDALARLLWDIHADSAPLVRVGGEGWGSGLGAQSCLGVWVWAPLVSARYREDFFYPGCSSSEDLVPPTRPSPVGHPC